MKKFVIIGIAIILAGITTLAAMSKMATGHETTVTWHTTVFDESHSQIIDQTSGSYTIKHDDTMTAKFGNDGVLATILNK